MDFHPEKNMVSIRNFHPEVFSSFALEEYSNCEKVCNFIVVQVFFLGWKTTLLLGFGLFFKGELFSDITI